MSGTQDYFDCPKCGHEAILTQDNTTCEVQRFCTNCDWNGGDCEQIQSYIKKLPGQVYQNYLLNKEGEYVCVGQYFVPNNQLDDTLIERRDEETDEPIIFRKPYREVPQEVVFAATEGDSYLSRFREWFLENKDSIELQNRYEKCKYDLEEMGETPPPFEEWAKVVFDLEQKQ